MLQELTELERESNLNTVQKEISLPLPCFQSPRLDASEHTKYIHDIIYPTKVITDKPTKRRDHQREVIYKPHVNTVVKPLEGSISSGRDVHFIDQNDETKGENYAGKESHPGSQEKDIRSYGKGTHQMYYKPRVIS